ncbi:MAG TPA: alpha/beta fold hydrolase [Thermoanaerobaculia bacterium]
MLVLLAMTFVTREVAVEGRAHRYQVALPAAPRNPGDAPIVLFLHGAGERGNDNVAQTTAGLGPVLKARGAQAIVVFPQCPEGESWLGEGRRIAMAALEATLRELGERRVVLTGMSMGGAGALLLATEHPRRFAKILAACPWVRTPPRLAGEHPDTPFTYADVAKSTAGIPLWLFHGEADALVPVQESRNLYAARLAIEGPRGETCFTELKGVGHGAWDAAYAQGLDWLVER